MDLSNVIDFSVVETQLTDDAKKWLIGVGNNGLSYILNNFSKQLITAPKIQTTLPSAKIGLLGESEVCTILRKYKTVNTSQTGKCGDFIIIVDGVKILIEIKKWSSTVSSAEINKFYRDIRANASVDAGFLISLSSKIVGLSGVINQNSIIVTGTKIPTYFACLVDVDKRMSPTIINACIDMIHASVKNEKIHLDIGEKIVSAIDTISINVDLLSQCRLSVHETQAVVNKNFAVLMQKIIEAEISIKNTINAIKAHVCKNEVKEIVHHDFNVCEKYKKLLTTVLDTVDHTDLLTNASKSLITTKSNKMHIKLNKTSVKITMELPIDKVYDELRKLPNTWNKFVITSNKCTLDLDETSLQTIIVLLKLVI
jgi:hypothetical protein